MSCIFAGPVKLTSKICKKGQKCYRCIEKLKCCRCIKKLSLSQCVSWCSTCATLGTSCLLQLFCCCCGPKACGLCCWGCFGKAKSSVLTRLHYLSFLVVLLLVSAILLAPDVQRAMQNNGNVLCVNYNFSGRVLSNVVTFPAASNSTGANLSCDQIIGYLAVYRVCMGVALFFFGMMVTTLGAYRFKDLLSCIQNGFWCAKWFAVIVVTVVIFFIPDGRNLVFSKIAMATGLIGFFIFVILQVILLVDLAHYIAEYLVGKLKTSKEQKFEWSWLLLSMVVALIFYGCALVVSIALMYVYFTELESCALNKFFITSTLVFGVGVTVTAILPWIQSVQPKSGVIQAAFVSGYCTYLTWSAISSEPYGQDRDCHVSENTFAVFSNNGNALAASIIGILVILFTIIWICLSLSSKALLRKFIGDREDETEPCVRRNCFEDDRMCFKDVGRTCVGGDENEEKMWWMMTVVNDDEEEKATYNYSIFHFLMFISVLYLMMHLTNWAYPGEADFQNTWASVWVKMATVWVCYGVFFWTLIAPLVLGNCRDFGYIDQ